MTLGEKSVSLGVILITNNETIEEKPSFEETQPCG